MAKECGKFVDSYLREDRENPGQEKAVQLSTAYSCSLDSGHAGPCAARENQASMNARLRWENNSGVLKQFQGKAVTFAEGHAEPGSMLPHPNAINRERIEIPTDSSNPYVRSVTPEVGPPAKWIKPTPPESPGWNISMPNNEKTQMIYEAPITLYGNPVDEHWQNLELKFDFEKTKVNPTKNRPGDQSLPKKNDSVAIQDIAIQEIQDRKKIGLERYGSLLQIFNGRDSLQDAKEEALDLLMYLIQMQEERLEILEDFNIIVGVIREIKGNQLDPDLIEVILKVKNWLDPKDV